MLPSLRLKDVEDVSSTRPSETYHLFASHKADSLGDEALDRIINHLIDIDTIPLSIKSIILLSSLNDSFS